MSKVIEVVDTQIFKEKLQMADTVMPYVLSTLTTQKNVARFLGKSPLTIAKMIGDKRLTEGIHYIKDGKSIVFVPDAIIKYKMNPPSKEPTPKEAYKPSQEALEIIS